MLVSVIVPIYNVAPYLRQCLESVLNQTYKEIEVILVNDGSTDNSLDICKEYERVDTRVKVISQKNSGSSAARNTGLNTAIGEYILFIDSDDFWICNDCIKLLVEKVQLSHDDMIIFQSVKYYEKNNEYRETYESLDLNKFDNPSVKDTIHYLVQSGQIVACAWNKFIKRSVLIENNIYFTVGMVGEDIDWTLRLFTVISSISAVNVNMHAYRQQREGAITSTITPRKALDLFHIIKYWADYMENNESVLKNEILSFLAFEYAILIGRVEVIKDIKVKNSIKKYAYLLHFADDKKSNKVRILYSLCGFNLTSRIMKVYLENRK